MQHAIASIKQTNTHQHSTHLGQLPEQNSKPSERVNATKRSRFVRLVSLSLAFALAVASPALYAQVRLAVVDVQRAASESEEGRATVERLRVLFQSRQTQLDQRQQSLVRMREEIQRQQRTLGREALQQRMETYQRQFMELQQNYLEYQQELAQQEAEATKQIIQDLRGVIRQIGQQEGYTTIFDQAGVVWAPQHLDLTDRVVQMYNQQHPVRSDAGARPATPPRTTPPTTTPRP